jgi:hypothetical protein
MQEVSGSIPLGSTNLRRFAAAVGKPLLNFKIHNSGGSRHTFAKRRLR